MSKNNDEAFYGEHSQQKFYQKQKSIFSARNLNWGSLPNPSKFINLNKSYIKSPFQGIMRLVLITFLFASWVSAAAVVKDSSDFDNYSDLKSTRSAYLFFSIVGWLLSIAIFLLNLLSIVRIEKLKKIPFRIIFILCDIVILLSMFAVSIAAAAREGDLNSKSTYPSCVNKGAFAAAAFFGLVSCIVLVVVIISSIIRMFKGKEDDAGGNSANNADNTNNFSSNYNSNSNNNNNQYQAKDDNTSYQL